MSARIVIYQLRQKFVNQRQDIPETAQQIVYYTLAVGHHVGVLDCFSNLAEIPLEVFQSWLEGLPEGQGRTKLEGVLKWGEIEINRSHVSILMPLLEENASGARCHVSVIPSPESLCPDHTSPSVEQTAIHEMSLPDLLRRCLQSIVQEPALYLMIRKYT